MQEFKVGDNVRLEGTITDMWKSHVYVQLKGDSETVCNVRMDAMAHATLIEPGPKAPQKERPLDLNKPIRRKDNLVTVPYLGLTSSGHVITEDEEGDAFSLHQKELENIPEPKITTSDVLSLWEFKTGARAFLWGDAAGCATRLSRVRVSYTEGEGWSIEEVK